MSENSRDLEAPPGGIMTKEVGAITGPVTLTAEVGDGQTVVTVAYQEAEDAYTVEGSPLPGEVSVDEVLSRLTATAEGKTDPDGNPAFATLI